METLGEHQLLAFAVILTVMTMLSLQTGQAETLEGNRTSRLNFYLHDKLVGGNKTAVQVASADVTNSSKTSFGAVYVVDNLLTEGPDPTSKVVGRAQGIYASAGQEEARLLMALTFVLQSGEFNGSTLSVVANNPVFRAEREIPIVGGTGAFRLARGYAQARTLPFDSRSADAIVKYYVVVLH